MRASLEASFGHICAQSVGNRARANFVLGTQCSPIHRCKASDQRVMANIARDFAQQGWSQLQVRLGTAFVF